MIHLKSKRFRRLVLTPCLIALLFCIALIPATALAIDDVHEFKFNSQSSYWPTDGWRTSTPEAQGMSSLLLAELFEYIRYTELKLNSLLIIRNGYIVAEANVKPIDGLWRINSSTKSFTSAIMGIALEKGIIKNIDQTLPELFPEWYQTNQDPKKAAITLRHLLTMSSGFQWPEISSSYTDPINPVSQMTASKNWAHFALAAPLTEAPGRVFNYNSGGSHLLLSALQRKGVDVAEFAQSHLFAPMGITRSRYRWVCDNSGIPNGSHGLVMCPRDMAKFGYLYLKGGQWAGRPVVPQAWVKESTRKHIKVTWGGSIPDHYGFQWYIYDFGFHSLGWKGQYIFVIPDSELVVVFTAGLGPMDTMEPVKLVQGQIIPALKSMNPLPENENGMAALNKEIEAFNKKPAYYLNK